LKVIDVETFLLDPTLLIRVRVDEGLVGWGECSPMNSRVIQSHITHSLAPIILGMDPFDLERIIEECFVRTYKIAGQAQAIAFSGIEIALWDIMGKALGEPVHRLMGGTYRRKIRMYASSMRRDISPWEEADRMEALVEERGFTAVKVRVGSKFGFDADASPARSEEVVREVRERLGDDVEIMVDANSCFTAPRAIRLGRYLEEQGVFHFEEPCPYTDLESTARVARALDIPVAGGEQDWDIRRFKDMMTMGAVDIVQPDLIKVGGFSACKKVATMADAFGLVCTPHQTQPLGTVANLHLVASTPCCRYSQEYNIESHPWRSRIFRDPPEVRNGFMEVPRGPGLGVEINEEILEHAQHMSTG